MPVYVADGHVGARDRQGKIAMQWEEVPISILSKLEPVVIEEFSKQDFHQVDIRTICRKAEVGSDTIYKYFKNKEGLLFGFADKWFADLDRRLVDHLQGIENPRDRIKKIYWVSMDFYESNPGVGMVLWGTIPLRTWMHQESFRQEKLIRIFMDAFIEGQEKGYLNPNVSPAIMLDFAFGIIRRLFVKWLYLGRKYALGEQIDSTFDMFWRAIEDPMRIQNNLKD